MVSVHTKLSSAYKGLLGQPVWNSWDNASRTMMRNRKIRIMDLAWTLEKSLSHLFRLSWLLEFWKSICILQYFMIYPTKPIRELFLVNKNKMLDVDSFQCILLIFALQWNFACCHMFRLNLNCLSSTFIVLQFKSSVTCFISLIYVSFSKL